MGKRGDQIPSALKHGGYSGITLLPGEDPAAFKKLYDGLVAEFAPTGSFEEDVVESLARLTWRKRNLSTYRKVAAAKVRISALAPDPESRGPSFLDPGPSAEDLAAYEDAHQTARDQVRKEMGPAWELVEAGDIATIDHLQNELNLIDRLDGMIDRCLKRLLFVRGLKSVSSSSSATTAVASKRLPAA